jgi:hypothetical protein
MRDSTTSFVCDDGRTIDGRKNAGIDRDICLFVSNDNSSLKNRACKIRHGQFVNEDVYLG